MKINGVPISVCEFLGVYKLLKEIAMGEYRWFSGVTAMGFFYFAAKAVQVAVVETGIGGRLDGTNIIKNPLVAVVTSIGLDHVQMLGENLETIAKEKASIFKPGCSAVIGPNATPRKVFESYAITLPVSEFLLVPAEVTFESTDRENARVARSAKTSAYIPFPTYTCVNLLTSTDIYRHTYIYLRTYKSVQKVIQT